MQYQKIRKMLVKEILEFNLNMVSNSIGKKVSFYETMKYKCKRVLSKRGF